MPFPYSFSAGPPPPSLMPQASEAQRDLQRLKALKPPTNPATGLSARQSTKQAAEYRKALQDILDRYGSMDNFQEALQAPAGAPGPQLASAAASDVPDFMAGPLADPSLDQFAQNVAQPTPSGPPPGLPANPAAPGLPGGPQESLGGLPPVPGVPFTPGRGPGAGGLAGGGEYEHILSRMFPQMFQDSPAAGPGPLARGGAAAPVPPPPGIGGQPQTPAPPNPLAGSFLDPAGATGQGVPPGLDLGGAMAAGMNPIPQGPPGLPPAGGLPPTPPPGLPPGVLNPGAGPGPLPPGNTFAESLLPPPGAATNAAAGAGTGLFGMDSDFTNQNLLEFGLRMMAGSGADQGSRRVGPGLLDIVGKAGFGTLAGARKRKKETAAATTAERRHQDKMTLERKKIDISAVRNANDAETKRLLITIDQDNKTLDRRMDKMNLDVRVMGQISEIRKDFAEQRENVTQELAMSGETQTGEEFEAAVQNRLQELRAQEKGMVDRLMGMSGGGTRGAQAQTATNSKGKKVVLKNGQWVPVN